MQVLGQVCRQTDIQQLGSGALAVKGMCRALQHANLSLENVLRIATQKSAALTNEEGAARAVEAPGRRADGVQHKGAARLALAGGAGCHPHAGRLHSLGRGGEGSRW